MQLEGIGEADRPLDRRRRLKRLLRKRRLRADALTPTLHGEPSASSQRAGSFRSASPSLSPTSATKFTESKVVRPASG